MNCKSIKKFIAIFSIVVILLSFLIPTFEDAIYLAATVYQASNFQTTETTKEKPHGFKIENAEYWDYNKNYDKSRIWIDQGGGGGGSGGGAGDGNALEAGNSGTGNEAGGILGEAAGIGMGTGNTPNTGGKGGGTTGTGQGGQAGGSSGSALADALRALKEEIAESRAESLAKYLETALNASVTAESVAKRMREQESIQKKLAQESIMQKFAPKETKAIHETLKMETYEYKKSYVNETTNIDVTAPTANETERLNASIVDKNHMQTTEHVIDAVDIIKAQISKQKEFESIMAPTSEYVDPEIAPPEIDSPKANTPIISEIEPGDIVAQEESIKAEQTIQQSIQKAQQESMDNAMSEEESTGEKESDEGKGSKGGENPEEDQDKTGDDGSNESKGNANDKGQFQADKNGEHAGKKVFEIEVNGNLGFHPDRMSHISARKVAIAICSIVFILGAIVHLLSTRDKKDKRNYF